MEDEGVKVDLSDFILSFLNHYIADFDPNASGAFLVLMEMSLGLLGIILNLTVLISIKEKESLTSNTVTVILGNLCLSNLFSNVYVMSIAVIFHGYAVATSRWKVQLAFCSAYIMISRATWAVFPYTIVVLCWHGFINRAKMLLCESEIEDEDFGEHGNSFIEGIAHVDDENEEAPHDLPQRKSYTMEDQLKTEQVDEEIELSDGLTTHQKIAISFIWLTSTFYALMGDELISKEHENQCSVRSDLSEKLSNTSIMFVIGVPVFIGPFICLLGHILISTCVCLKNAVWKNRNSRHPNDSNDPVHGIVEHKLLIGFIMIFLIIYPTHMFIVEAYLSDIKTQFAFMTLKYFFGYMHVVLLPILILIMRRDIRKAVSETYQKGSNNDQDISFEDQKKSVKNK